MSDTAFGICFVVFVSIWNISMYYWGFQRGKMHYHKKRMELSCETADGFIDWSKPGTTNCPECGVPYPLAHKETCSIGEAYK